MPTKQELLERVHALLPAISARASESEEKRRPHDRSIQELIDAEVFQALVPERFGGHELNLDTMAAIVCATLASHAFVDWEVCREQYGRHFLGLPPNHPLV